MKKVDGRITPPINFFSVPVSIFTVVISGILILSSTTVTNMYLQCLVYPYVNALLLRCTY
jgi:hypothetical protein